MKWQNNRDCAWRAIAEFFWQLGSYEPSSPSTKELHGYWLDLWVRHPKVNGWQMRVETIPLYLSQFRDEKMLVQKMKIRNQKPWHRFCRKKIPVVTPPPPEASAARLLPHDFRSGWSYYLTWFTPKSSSSSTTISRRGERSN